LRREEYNNNPHFCKFCQKPILMHNEDSFNFIFNKVFCSRSCATQYRYKENPKFNSGLSGKRRSRIDTDFSDEELIRYYNESKNVKDLERKLGFKAILTQHRIIDRFLQLGLSISDLKCDRKPIPTLTKKELFDKSNHYQTARSQIQKWARIIYKESSKPKQCIVCGYSKHFEVAHIKAVADFDDDALVSEINDIDNLIALCPNHHWEYDNNELDISYCI